MREILFRGKWIGNNEWVEGFYVASCASIVHPYSYKDGIHYIRTIPHNMKYYVDPETICQYTGLTDKNGRKIFEGDIVRCGGMLVVKWDEKFAGWCITKEGWLYNHFFGEAFEPIDCEVIGNIFDNQELLEVGK